MADSAVLRAYAAAVYPAADVETLTALISFGDVELRRAIAKRFFIPLPVVELLVDDEDGAVRDAIDAYMGGLVRREPLPYDTATLVRICAQLHLSEAALSAARRLPCTSAQALTLAGHDHGVVALTLLDRFAGPDRQFATAICELWAPRMMAPILYVGAEAVMARVLPLSNFSPLAAAHIPADFALLVAPDFVTAGLSPDSATMTLALATDSTQSVSAVRAAATLLLSA